MAIKTSKSQTNYYALYKTSRKWESNRKRRLLKTLKEQPNNKQALESLVYRRKTPSTHPWSASWIRAAKIIKLFEGRFDPKIMSANQDVARQALQHNSKNTEFVPPQGHKNFFSLEARTWFNSSK